MPNGGMQQNPNANVSVTAKQKKQYRRWRQPETVKGGGMKRQRGTRPLNTENSVRGGGLRGREESKSQRSIGNNSKKIDR